jgi:hypothetical protein
MYLTKHSYQNQRMNLIAEHSDKRTSQKRFDELGKEIAALDERWKKQARELMVADVRLPRLGDLEADCDHYGKPMCCAQHIPAAFICCNTMYYLQLEKITCCAEKSGYLPAHLELRLVVTIDNAAEYTLQTGDEFTMEGMDFRMISDKEAIMQNGLKNLDSWTRTSYLWGNVITDFVTHKYSDQAIGATFIYQPRSVREGY